MKKGVIPKILALILLLVMVSASIVSGTFAKFVTTETATGTVTVAKWVANLTDGDGEVVQDETFNLISTSENSIVAGDLIAPGTKGEFSINYTTKGSQVARKVTIIMEPEEADYDITELENFKFYDSDNVENRNEIDFKETAFGGENASGYYELLDEEYGPTDDGEGDITIYWEWPFELTAGEVGGNNTFETIDEANQADTGHGKEPKTYNFKVTFTAEQLDEYPTTP
jgi:hypothetical protein